MKITNGLSVSGVIFGVATAFAGPVHHYEYSVRIPSSAAGCAANARALAHAFAAFDKSLLNVTGECVGTDHLTENGHSYSLDSLSVDYESSGDLPVTPFTATLDEDLLAGENLTAVYSDYQDCLGDIGPQMKTFSSATGLAVIAAFCEPEQSSDPTYGYKMTIAGLGDAKASLYHVENSAFESVTTDTDWSTQIQNLLALQGAVLTKHVGGLYYYYARSTVPLASGSLVVTGADADCESQAAQAHAFVAKLGAHHSVVTCHTNDMGHTLDVLADISDWPPSDYGAGSRAYGDFAACMTDLKHQEGQDAANGDSLTFRFCGWNDNSQYEIESYRAAW